LGSPVEDIGFSENYKRNADSKRGFSTVGKRKSSKKNHVRISNEEESDELPESYARGYYFQQFKKYFFSTQHLNEVSFVCFVSYFC
jgi:hypothetical protein